MNYKNINDNELIYLTGENNEEAITLLIKKYDNFIKLIAKSYIKHFNIVNMEESDLYQEGLIGFLNAINTYNENKNVKFYTYATICIKNNMIDSIKNSFRQKNMILNNSYSLDNLTEQYDPMLYSAIIDYKNEPNKILIDNEIQNEISTKLKSKLSKMECMVFEYKFKGYTNSEIASMTSRSKRTIETIIFRINKKIKECNII